MTLEPIVLKRIVLSVIRTRPDEIVCSVCMERLEIFAAMHLVGQDAAEAMPLTQDHLERCDDCREEFEALLYALRALSLYPGQSRVHGHGRP